MSRNETRLGPTERGSLAWLTDEEIAQAEAANAVRQFDLAQNIVADSLSSSEGFTLLPATVRVLNREALVGLERTPGDYRSEAIEILGSRHRPPDWRDIPELVQEACDYVGSSWRTATAIHLAAFSMWRLAWIHPFPNGNGRTSRVVGYMVLSAHLGTVLAGKPTLPTLIIRERRRYYRALQHADGVWLRKKLFDVSKLEDLLAELLQEQLSSLDHQG